MTDEAPDHRAIDSSDLHGRSVRDTDDEELGTVDSLQIDPESLCIAGVVVSRGLLKNDVIVGVEYVDRIEEDAVRLNVDITLFIEGRDVIDADGELVGTVAEVDRVRETNSLKGLFVSGPEGDFYVESDDIREISSEGVYLE